MKSFSVFIELLNKNQDGAESPPPVCLGLRKKSRISLLQSHSWLDEGVRMERMVKFLTIIFFNEKIKPILNGLFVLLT